MLTDDHVPTLDEVLALAAPAGVAMLVEIKTPGQDVRYERRGEQVQWQCPARATKGWSEGARLRCGVPGWPGARS